MSNPAVTLENTIITLNTDDTELELEYYQDSIDSRVFIKLCESQKVIQCVNSNYTKLSSEDKVHVSDTNPCDKCGKKSTENTYWYSVGNCLNYYKKCTNTAPDNYVDYMVSTICPTCREGILECVEQSIIDNSDRLVAHSI